MLSPTDHELLQDWLAGELAAADATAVEKRLKDDAEFAKALLLMAREEAIFADWARLAERTTQVAAQLPPRSSGLARTMPRRWFAVAAAALLAVGATWLASRVWLREPAMAKVEHVDGRVYAVKAGVREPVDAGRELIAGQGLELVGDEAMAVILYADGTRLEFDGDTVVTELSGNRTTGKRVVLTTGNVRADVAKQPPGLPMVLKTANAEVVVLGTKFDLSGSAQATYVETAEGAVRLIRAGDGQAIEVPAGFEGLADNEPSMNAQPSPPRFRQPRLTTEGCDSSTLLSPDGKTLVTSRYKAGAVTLWSVADGKERLTFTAHKANIDATAFSRDGQKLATYGLDRKINLWDPANGRPLQSFDAPERVQSLHFSADGATLFAIARFSQNDLRLHSWNLASGTENEARKFRGEVWAFSTAGQTLAVASVRDKNVLVLDLVSGRMRAEFGNLPARVLSLGVSPDESRVAISDRSGRVVLQEIDSGKELQTFLPPGGSVQGLTFSPDGANLAMGMRYATVRIWDLTTGKQRYVLEGNRRPGATASVRPMFFSPDQKVLVSTESLGDSVVRLWELPTK